MGKKIKKFKPKISIIIPNFNKGKYIEQAIKSLINQNYKNWKALIIDDKSTDNSKKILKKYNSHPKIKIIFLKKNKGPSYCRNLGIIKSKSNFIAFLDSDDFWPKHKLSTQVNFMVKNNLSFTFTDYISFYQNENRLKKIGVSKVPNSFDFSSFIKNSSINTSTIIIKKNLIKNIKFKNLMKHEDYIFKCEIFKKNKGLIARKCIQTFAHYRILKNSRSQNKFKSVYYLWKYNKKFNGLGILKNFNSIFNISLNSIKKYGLK
tara:strand:+ start:10826 stop:11611 length:786 start_codon:yes stop_codon:yes gene_type:complete